MTRRESYIKAAKLVDRGDQQFSCNAVEVVNFHASRIYSRAMGKRLGKNIYDLSIEDITDAVQASFRSEEARNFRVLLLCMMAACCDDIGEIDGLV